MWPAELGVPSTRCIIRGGCFGSLSRLVASAVDPASARAGGCFFRWSRSCIHSYRTVRRMDLSCDYLPMLSFGTGLVLNTRGRGSGRKTGQGAGVWVHFLRVYSIPGIYLTEENRLLCWWRCGPVRPEAVSLSEEKAARVASSRQLKPRKNRGWAFVNLLALELLLPLSNPKCWGFDPQGELAVVSLPLSEASYAAACCCCGGLPDHSGSTGRRLCSLEPARKMRAAFICRATSFSFRL